MINYRLLWLILPLFSGCASWNDMTNTEKALVVGGVVVTAYALSDSSSKPVDRPCYRIIGPGTIVKQAC